MIFRISLTFDYNIYSSYAQNTENKKCQRLQPLCGAERQASAGQRGGVCGRVARQEQPEQLRSLCAVHAEVH